MEAARRGHAAVGRKNSSMAELIAWLLKHLCPHLLYLRSA
jgi:hypothetical protein